MIDYKNILNSVPGYILTKDVNSVISYVNDEFAELLGFPCGTACVGLTDDDLNCDAFRHAEKFREQDRYVMAHQQLNSMDYIRYSDKKFHLVLSQKRLLLEADGSVHGIIFHGLDISSEFRKGLFVTLSSMLSEVVHGSVADQKSTELIPAPYAGQLTARQLEVLYYYIYGHSAKNIAKTLNLSPKTVESHIDRIKQYGNCSSRAQLIQWAVDQGVFYILPGI